MANRFGPKGLQMRDVNAVRGLLTGFRNQLHGLIKLKDCCAIELKNQECLNVKFDLAKRKLIINVAYAYQYPTLSANSIFIVFD